MKLVLNISEEYDYFPLTQRTEMFKTAGFEGSDMGLFQMVKQDHGFNGENWLSLAEELKTAYAKAGVPIVQTHAPFQFKGMDDPIFRKEMS